MLFELLVEFAVALPKKKKQHSVLRAAADPESPPRPSFICIQSISFFHRCLFNALTMALYTHHIHPYPSFLFLIPPLTHTHTHTLPGFHRHTLTVSSFEHDSIKRMGTSTVFKSMIASVWSVVGGTGPRCSRTGRRLGKVASIGGRGESRHKKSLPVFVC